MKYMRYINVLIFLSLFTINNNCIQGQVLVQLEKYDDPQAIKFGPGNYLHYKTRTSEDTWTRSKIEKIDYENQLIVFVRGYEKLDDITHIKIVNQTTKVLGDKLMQFSILWFLYGGITHLISDDYKFGWDTAGIGAGAFFTGFVIKKLGGEKIYNVKKRDRLRIIDISWPEPRG
jgi:hypothetical protein